MIYVQLTDGVVVNRAVFDGDVPKDWPDRDSWIAHDEAQIGWGHLDGKFEPPKPPEPQAIPRRVLTPAKLLDEHFASMGVSAADLREWLAK